MKLHLGCGPIIKEGYVNVDVEFYEGVNVIADLEKDWPFESDSVDEIFAKDILEHLPDIIHSMNEIWRVLKMGGTVEIYVPTTRGAAAFQDPTHKSWWNENTFSYFASNEPGVRPVYRQIHCWFKIVEAKPYIYKGMPNAFGVYVKLEKVPLLSACLAKSTQIETE